jgi:hypothetical protein
LARPSASSPWIAGLSTGERFIEAMHRKMFLEGFALDADLQTPLKLIALFLWDSDPYYLPRSGPAF